MLLPFEPLLLPLDKSLVNMNKIIIPVTNAATALGMFDVRIRQKDIYTNHALRHIVTMESLYSTRIEGTQTTVDAVYEAGADVEPRKVDKDTNEVLKYSEAIYHGVSCINNGIPISNKLIKELHSILLSGAGVRKNANFQPGVFRTQQNRVGEHIPPAAVEVENYMGNLENYINCSNDAYDDSFPPLLKIALIHAQFETIHPFPDGNGRVGRILIPLYLFKESAISTPYFLISQELERNRTRYYQFLQGTRTKTEDGITQWICFFLDCIEKQAKKDVKFIDSMNQLYLSTDEKLKEKINSSKTEQIVTAMFRAPVFTISKLAQLTNINPNTLRPYIKSLVKDNILFSDQTSRNTKYCFADLIDLIRQ